MNARFAKITPLLVAAVVSASSAAEPPAPAEGKPKDPAQWAKGKLTVEEIAGAKENYLVPAPGDILGVLGAVNTDWKKLWLSLKDSRPAKDKYETDVQTGAALGIWVADATLALKGQDQGALEESANRILALVRGLGADKSVEDAGLDLAVLAEEAGKLVKEGKWQEVAGKLETIRAGALYILKENQDLPAANAAIVAGWLRGLNTAAGIVTTQYSDAAAKHFRQNDLATYLEGVAGKLPAGKAAELSTVLGKIAALLKVDQGAPVSKESLETVKGLTTEALTLIQA